jgi:methyl coenzyme M reductase subunit C-like uncharacterized protein (methanogenesis marker protein 7)
VIPIFFSSVPNIAARLLRGKELPERRNKRRKRLLKEHDISFLYMCNSFQDADDNALAAAF